MMKRFKASDLTHNRAEVMKEAKVNGVIIECRNTNGEVVDELVMVKASDMKQLTDGVMELESIMIEIAKQQGVDHE